MKHLYFFVFLLMMIMACAGPKHLPGTSSDASIMIDGKLWSSLFEQKAAEYKALCIQAYNIARLRLDEALAQSSSKPKAIISDIDETFLDNSPYSIHQAFQGKDYEVETWHEWTVKGAADTLSGALSFFNYAASKNVQIFYITNRDEKDKEGTLQNLKRYHFPFADSVHVIVRQNTSSKETRRQQVAANYDIVLLLGDNLADFSTLFDKKTTMERAVNVQQSAAEFGKRFIVFPNANYGGWEDAVYGNTNLSIPQKDSAIKSNLKGY